MRLNITMLASVLLALLAGACGSIVGPTAQEMTLVAQNDGLGTQIAQLQSTATVEVDRMMITVEHAQTEVSGVQSQRDAMRATAVARGTDSSFFDISIPSVDDAPPPDNNEDSAENLPEGITPEGLLPQGSIDDSGDPLAEAPAVTPPGGQPISPNLNEQNTAATPLPQNDNQQNAANGARLTNPTLATGYGSDDCAVGASTSFPDTTPEIYIVTNAVDFPANTTVSTTWLREGEVMESYSYTYDFAIEGNCIWSFIDQSDFAFTPGNWSVEMDVSNGTGVGPVNFTITGTENSGNTDNMGADGQ